MEKTAHTLYGYSIHPISLDFILDVYHITRETSASYKATKIGYFSQLGEYYDYKNLNIGYKVTKKQVVEEMLTSPYDRFGLVADDVYFTTIIKAVEAFVKFKESQNKRAIRLVEDTASQLRDVLQFEIDMEKNTKGEHYE